MNIIIPMAGMGKRMRPHTLTTPKPLISIAGKPIVQRLVEDILATATTKVEKIAFIISPAFGAPVEQLLISIAEDLGAEAHIVYQEEALGTGHAIMCAKDLLEGEVFIAFADTLFDAQFTIDTSKDAIIWTQKVEDPSQFGVVRLDETGRITAFVEKPQEFVSDLAIIGVYFFKDGRLLKKHLQHLLDNNIMEKGEYQLTAAMENMRNEGVGFYTDVVKEWLDCGNKDATVYTNQRILELKKNKETFVSPSAQLTNVQIIEPVYIGANTTISHSVIGPHVSIEAGTAIEQSVVKNSIILKDTHIRNRIIEDSMVGNHVRLEGQAEVINIGDYTAM